MCFSVMETIKRNIWILNVFHILHGLMFFLPVFALLLEAKLESVFFVTFVMAAQSVLILLLEVPSGAVSDKYGRKNTIMFSAFSFVVGLLFLYFGKSLLMIMMYVIFNSIGRSFWSGTNSSMIYESKPKNFKKTIGFHNSLWSLGASIGAIVGGFIALKDMNLTVFYTLIPFFISFIITFFLIEPKRHKKHESLFSHMSQATKHIFNEKVLLFSMLHILFIFACMEVIFQLRSLYFIEKNIDMMYLGLLSTLSFGFSFLGYNIGYKISDWLGDKKTLLFASVSPLLLLIISIMFDGLIAGILFAIGSIFWGSRQVVINHIYHKFSKDNIRATTISIGNFANQLGFAMSAPLLGYLADILTITQTYLISLLFFIPAILMIFFIKVD